MIFDDELLIPSVRVCDFVSLDFFFFDAPPREIIGAFNFGVETSLVDDLFERVSGLFNVEDDVLFHVVGLVTAVDGERADIGGFSVMILESPAGGISGARRFCCGVGIISTSAIGRDPIAVGLS